MDDFSRDEEIDRYYAVLGRALAFATRFELNCRLLARFIALRMNPEILAEPVEAQSAFIEKARATGRCGNTSTLSDRYSLTYQPLTS